MRTDTKIDFQNHIANIPTINIIRTIIIEIRYMDECPLIRTECSTVIICIAERLTGMLRRRDPIAGRVALNPVQFALCGGRGMWRVLT